MIKLEIEDGVPVDRVVKINLRKNEFVKNAIDVVLQTDKGVFPIVSFFVTTLGIEVSRWSSDSFDGIVRRDKEGRAWDRWNPNV